MTPEYKADISSFIASLSKAFLPSCVMELEEYGLPRMLAKKNHASGSVNSEDEKLDLHSKINFLRDMQPDFLGKAQGFDSFDM